MAEALPAIEVEETSADEEKNKVRSNKCSKNTQISPAVLEFVAERFVELITDLICAVLAEIGGIIQDVSRGTVRKEIAHVGPTILAVRCIEVIELCGCTLDGSLVELGDDHATDETSKRIQ